MSCCNGDVHDDTVKSIESTILENFSDLEQEEIDQEIVSFNHHRVQTLYNSF
jgi:hypothetical protein